MDTFRLIIQFTHGKKVYLENVSSYTVNNESGSATVVINGHEQFFMRPFFVYIGREDDLEPNGKKIDEDAVEHYRA